MYARKYYFLYIEEICYLYIEEICYLNIQEPVSNNIQEPVSNPSSFYVKSLLTFWPFCHSLHTSYSSNSPRSPFTFSLSLFHLFLSIFSPFPYPFPSYLPHHSFLSTSQHPGQRLKKTGTTLSFLAKMY